MERKAYWLILILLIAINFVNANNYRDSIYSAYITGDMNKWEKVLIKIQSENLEDEHLVLELLNYQYGYVAWCIGNDQDDQAKKYIKESEGNIEYLEKRSFRPSMIEAYKAAFYGYRIGLNPVLAPFLGRKSINSAKLANELNPANPFVYVQLGNIEFYRPAIFGGSKKEGLKYFLKAEELWVNSTDYSTNDWNYLSLLVTIAQAYEHLKEWDLAFKYYEKILRIEPDFEYVKDKLFPELIEKIKAN